MATENHANNDSCIESTRFSSILVARCNSERPSDLEIQLRSKCQKVRVYQQLSGAHFILPQVSSLAVRAYYPADVERFESKKLNDSDKNYREQELDGIVSFVQKFQWSVIFFVLPLKQMQTQLDNPHSMVHKVQDFLDRNILLYRAKNEIPSQATSFDISTQTRQPPRIFCLSSTEQTVDCLITVTESLAPQRFQKRKDFFERQQISNFCCSFDSTTKGSGDNTALKNMVAAAASSHTSMAMRQWADRYDLPTGEVDVLMKALGNLAAITRADASTVENAPIESRTKTTLQLFFDQETKGSILQSKVETPLDQPPAQNIFDSSACVVGSSQFSADFELHAAIGNQRFLGQGYIYESFNFQDGPQMEPRRNENNPIHHEQHIITGLNRRGQRVMSQPFTQYPTSYEQMHSGHGQNNLVQHRFLNEQARYVNQIPEVYAQQQYVLNNRQPSQYNTAQQNIYPFYPPVQHVNMTNDSNLQNASIGNNMQRYSMHESR